MSSSPATMKSCECYFPSARSRKTAISCALNADDLGSEWSKRLRLSAGYEHTKLVTLPSRRTRARSDGHERPHAAHALRLRSARRDGRGGQAGEEMPRLLARCAARVAASMAQGRTRAGIISLAKCSRLAFTARVRTAMRDQDFTRKGEARRHGSASGFFFAPMLRQRQRA